VNCYKRVVFIGKADCFLESLGDFAPSVRDQVFADLDTDDFLAKSFGDYRQIEVFELSHALVGPRMFDFDYERAILASH